MSTATDALAELFQELTLLTILDEGSPNAFRVRAYENAVEAIKLYPGDLSELSEKELTKLDGIGKSTAKKILEYFESGTIAKLEVLREKYPPELVELTTIPGLGPKTLLRLRNELGIQNISDLRAAIDAKKLRELKGLGEKAEEKLAHAIERMGRTGKDRRTPIAQALPMAEGMALMLDANPHVERTQVCGSLRRFRETIGDIDIVVASLKPLEVMESFVGMAEVKEIIGRGETKTSILTDRGLQVDLRVVKPDQFGAACQYFTGSKAHNIKLRTIALERGWLLNEYGLIESETGQVIASDTEEAIYRAFGMATMPAPMREDHGEIERGLEARLPQSVGYDDIRGDLHLHAQLPDTTRGTVEDLVLVAADRGYSYVALVDDSGGKASEKKLGQQRREITAMDKRHPGMSVLLGAQLDIAADGSVEGDAGYYRELDWCIASVRSDFDLDASKQTQRILTAMEDPSVDAIAHLTGRQIGNRPGMELDFDAVFQKAAETGTAIEITALLDRLDPPSDVLLRARDLDVTFILSSEAKTPAELARMRWAVRQAQRGWVNLERIANCWPHKKFLKWLQKRRL